MARGVRKYNIRWKDYPAFANVWKPIINLVGRGQLCIIREKGACTGSTLLEVDRQQQFGPLNEEAFACLSEPKREWGSILFMLWMLFANFMSCCWHVALQIPFQQTDIPSWLCTRAQSFNNATRTLQGSWCVGREMGGKVLPSFVSYCQFWSHDNAFKARVHFQCRRLQLTTEQERKHMFVDVIVVTVFAFDFARKPYRYHW